MAEEATKEASQKEVKAAPKAGAQKEVDKEFGRKCAFTGVTLRKVRRYYRDGLYYINKRAYQDHAKKLKEEETTKKADEDAAKAKAAAAKAEVEAKQAQAKQAEAQTATAEGPKAESPEPAPAEEKKEGE